MVLSMYQFWVKWESGDAVRSSHVGWNEEGIGLRLVYTIAYADTGRIRIGLRTLYIICRQPIKATRIQAQISVLGLELRCGFMVHPFLRYEIVCFAW
jgi:hypothetical protein